MPPNDKEIERLWNRPIRFASGVERVLSLLSHPLGERVWNHPFVNGTFTVEDYWEARASVSHRYTSGWPSEPFMIANMLKLAGLPAVDIPDALEKETQYNHWQSGAVLDLYCALTSAFQIPKVDGLTVLGWAFRQSAQKGSVWNNGERFEPMFQALQAYDGSAVAQQQCVDDFLAAVGKYPSASHDDLDGESSSRGVFPERRRGRYRENASVFYERGLQGMGVALVNVFERIDDVALTQWFHQRHDVYGLGCLCVRERLPVSTLLHLLLNPGDAPYPIDSRRFLSESEGGAELLRKMDTKDVIMRVLSAYSPDELQQELQDLGRHSPDILHKLQALQPLDDVNRETLPGWMTWHALLNRYHLLDTDSPAFQHSLRLLQTQIDQGPSLPSGSLNIHMSKNMMTPEWSAFLNLHSTLATLGGIHFFHNAVRHTKSTERWEYIRDVDVSFLKKANMTPHFGSGLLENQYGGGMAILTQAAMVLPKFNLEDQATLAPLVALFFGARSVAGFSPSTFRNIWKEQNPEYFKASIPKHYTDDTYMLYALTRKNADGLLQMLDSLNLRQDRDAYLQAVRTWVREAFELPNVEHQLGDVLMTI